MFENLPTVRSGYWLYDGTVRLPVRIVQSQLRYGTGDYEDEPQVREDVVGKCFYLVYTTLDGHETHGSCFDSVEAAIIAAAGDTNGTAVFEPPSAGEAETI